MKPNEHDLPHSDAGHNPLWCGGDCNGQCCGDDPCWSCILWAFDKLVDLEHGVPKANPCPECHEEMTQ